MRELMKDLPWFEITITIPILAYGIWAMVYMWGYIHA